MNVKRASARRWPLPAVACAVAVVMVAAAAPAAATGASEGQVRHAGGLTAIPGSYIVVLKPQAAASTVATKATELAGLHSGRIGHVYTAALQGFAAELTEREARRLAANPVVAYVQQNHRVTIQGGSQIRPPSWGLDRVDQPGPLASNVYAYPNTAAGVRIYVIDTGIRVSHVDFGGRAVSGFDSIDGGPADDCNGHGTHVAGTAGGSAYGVAKGATLVAVRVLDCGGGGSYAGVIAGIDWVTADHDPGEPAVANMSLGGPADAATDQAVRNSIADGVTYSLAAGNNGGDACNQTPARTLEAITVGATASNDVRAGFSNFGMCLDVFAPGVGITSAWSTSDTATNTIDGTSMAAPHVAGMAALTLAANPWYTPQQVRDRIVNTASPNRVIDPGPGSPNLLIYTLGASDAPTITSLFCDSASRRFSCGVSFGGGVAPFQSRWTYNGSPVPSWDNLTNVGGGCQVGVGINITVSIIGGTGLQDSRATPVACRRTDP